MHGLALCSAALRYIHCALRCATKHFALRCTIALSCTLLKRFQKGYERLVEQRLREASQSCDTSKFNSHSSLFVHSTNVGDIEHGQLTAEGIQLRSRAVEADHSIDPYASIPEERVFRRVVHAVNVENQITEDDNESGEQKRTCCCCSKAQRKQIREQKGDMSKAVTRC
jgi:hypothetical protein